MEEVNVQTDHIAKVVCAFMSAATPVNIVKTFERAGIGVAVDDGVLRCRVCPDMRRLLLMPMIPAVIDDDNDDLEAELYRGQCTSLLFDDDNRGE
jgi:predicted sugar kinase